MCVCLVVSERYCFPQLFTTSLSYNLSPLLPKRFQCIGNDLGLYIAPFFVVCTLHLIAAGKGIVGISLMMCQLVCATPEQVPISRQTGLDGGRRKNITNLFRGLCAHPNQQSDNPWRVRRQLGSTQMCNQCYFKFREANPK